MPSHQDRREPLPKGYQFGDAGREPRLTVPTLLDYVLSEKLGRDVRLTAAEADAFRRLYRIDPAIELGPV